MPHFDERGNDTWICQKCATVRSTEPPVNRPDIHRGNVCKACVAKHDAGQAIPKPTRQTVAYDLPEYERADAPPIGLRDYARQESGGLTGPRLDDYINRYYGHA